MNKILVAGKDTEFVSALDEMIEPYITFNAHTRRDAKIDKDTKFSLIA